MLPPNDIESVGDIKGDYQSGQSKSYAMKTAAINKNYEIIHTSTYKDI
jgi:hypothetical protein